MKLIIDKDIPFIYGVFEPYAQVVYMKGADIDHRAVHEADALIIRTRTKCDAALLSGSRVKLIASATIGKDHVDLDYCDKNGIRFVNAAGCNAGGVMQYVYTALFGVADQKKISLCHDIRTLPGGAEKTVLGVVGVGNVGSRVADFGEYMGFEVLRNDPPKEREQTLAFNNGQVRLRDFKTYYSLEYLLEHADIVTMHVPLEPSTAAMANETFFAAMKPGACFINSSRGEVVDEKALLKYRSRFSAVILDVWNHEPEINRSLLDVTDIATPHIAGYSYEGKINGTTMVVKAVAAFFQIAALENFQAGEPGESENKPELRIKDRSRQEIWQSLNAIFPIFEMDKLLRMQPENFETIRSNYKYRREFYVNAES